jgi:hypothetical protein
MTRIVTPPTPIIGTTGCIPDLRFMATQDNYDAVTTPGYLNEITMEGFPLSNNSIIMMFYNYSLQNGGSVDNGFDFFSVAIDGNGVITLAGW